MKSPWEHTILMGFYLPVLFKKRNSQYKKASYPKYHPCSSPCRSSEQCTVNSLQLWKAQYPQKQQTDFILIHNSQEVEIQIKVSMPTMLWEQTTELLQIWDPISAHPFYPTHLIYLLETTFEIQLSLPVPLFPYLWNKGDRLSTY